MCLILSVGSFEQTTQFKQLQTTSRTKSVINHGHKLGVTDSRAAELKARLTINLWRAESAATAVQL